MRFQERFSSIICSKQLTINSGFFKKLQPGDCFLGDRSFHIEDELADRGAFLQILKFTCGKSRLSAKHVDESRQLSNVRSHVESVTGQLKNQDFTMNFTNCLCRFSR